MGCLSASKLPAIVVNCMANSHACRVPGAPSLSSWCLSSCRCEEEHRHGIEDLQAHAQQRGEEEEEEHSVLQRPRAHPESCADFSRHPSWDFHLLVFFLLTVFHHVQARAKQEGRQFDVAAHLFAGRMSFSDHACSSYE